MNPSSLGIFIEPQGALRSAVLERKALLESLMPGQAYTRHPPHCTLLFGVYGSVESWIKDLRSKIAQTPAFSLETDGWQEFSSDALAGGGHTVAYRVAPSFSLLQLQRDVAGLLASFHRTTIETHPLANREPFATSLKQYGSPFVGPHWLPHITIGSPQVGPDDPLLARLMSGPVQHRFAVRTLSVWRVAGDSHERLHELALAGTQI